MDEVSHNAPGTCVGPLINIQQWFSSGVGKRLHICPDGEKVTLNATN